MPRLACWSCGRQIYTVSPVESLFAEERRCLMCGAYMNVERRGVERRLRIRRQNPPTDPGPPAETDERRVEERRTSRRRSDGGSGELGRSRRSIRRDGRTDDGARGTRRRLTVRLAVLGLGLIGGSVARSVRGDPSVSIAAWSPSGAGPRAAHEAGVVDLVADTVEGAIGGANLIVLAGPPLACLELLDALGGDLRSSIPDEATITDVASTKGAIVARANALGLPFVGGHPMAGQEVSGFGASTADLFEDRPWIVVPGLVATSRDVLRVEGLARACGARPIRLTAEEHDRAVAAISHLPLVVAAALVEAVSGPGGRERDDWPLVRRLAATGWGDMTRLARGDPEMAAGIAATNAEALSDRLRDLRDVIDRWLDELESDRGPDGGPDAARLAERFRQVRARAEERAGDD
jgi:prephenate dehydrogenase